MKSLVSNPLKLFVHQKEILHKMRQRKRYIPIFVHQQIRKIERQNLDIIIYLISKFSQRNHFVTEYKAEKYIGCIQMDATFSEHFVKAANK